MKDIIKKGLLLPLDQRLNAAIMTGEAWYVKDIIEGDSQLVDRWPRPPRGRRPRLPRGR